MGCRAAAPAALAALALALLACSAAPAEPDPPRPTVALTPEERLKPATCQGTWVAAATGRVVDSSGARVQGASVGYCVSQGESGTCLEPATSEKGGWYTVRFADRHRCVDKVAVRVFVPKERGLRLADTYCAPPLAPKDGVLEAPDHVLIKLEAPTSMPPAGDPKKAREITFPGGLAVTIVPDDLIDADGVPALSAGRVDLGSPGCAPREPMDALFAFGPELGVRIFGGGKKIPFRLPAGALPEGTKVDLFILGGTGTQLDETRAVPEATYARFGEGRVRSGFVVPEPGSELPALTAVGFRRK